MMMNIFLISVFLVLPLFINAAEMSTVHNKNVQSKTKFVSKNDLGSSSNNILEHNTIMPLARTISNLQERGRKKKHKITKYLLPLLLGFVLIKSILLPIALKALAVMSGKAVILSLMSLILAAIVGLKKISHSGDKSVDIVTVPLSKYRRKDMFYDWDEAETEDPYGYYRDRSIDIPRKTRHDKDQ